MFDPTVSLGSLLTIGSFLVIVIVYVVGGRTDTKVLDTRLQFIDAQMEDFKLEMRKLGDILLKQALQEGRIVNVETRMLMEGERIDAMESTFRNYLAKRRIES